MIFNFTYCDQSPSNHHLGDVFLLFPSLKQIQENPNHSPTPLNLNEPLVTGFYRELSILPCFSCVLRIYRCICNVRHTYEIRNHMFPKKKCRKDFKKCTLHSWRPSKMYGAFADPFHPFRGPGCRRLIPLVESEFLLPARKNIFQTTSWKISRQRGLTFIDLLGFVFFDGLWNRVNHQSPSKHKDEEYYIQYTCFFLFQASNKQSKFFCLGSFVNWIACLRTWPGPHPHPWWVKPTGWRKRM